MKAVSRRLAITAALTTFGTAGGFAGSWLGGSHARAAVDAQSDPHLFFDPNAPVLGNPSGPVHIAEFFDYRCPYCRSMNPMIDRLLRDEHDIRFVAKNWPILGPVSQIAARVALAANWQGRFAAVNEALFTVPGRLDEAKVRNAAVSAGVDMARLDRDLVQRAGALDDMLGDVALEAASLGLQGTPGFLIGDTLVPGALSYDDLRSTVAKARAAARQSSPALTIRE